MPTNKQRREASRRHLERQLQRRQQEAARRKQRNTIATVVGIVAVLAVIGVVIALSSSNSKKSSASSSASPSASTAAVKTAGPCGYTQTGAPAKDVGVPPDPAPTPTTNRVISVTTTQGAMEFTLNGAAAPCNVQSIAFLATQGYYDNTICHRLVTSGIYVLQCGDPKGDGSGGPGYSVKDENLTSADYSQVGTIAMANNGADTNGSQFFIIWKDSSSLPKSYTVIGKVTAGIDVVQKVAAAGVAPTSTDSASSAASGSTTDGAPKLAITISKMTVVPPVTGTGTFVTPSPTAPATSSPAASTAGSGSATASTTDSATASATKSG